MTTRKLVLVADDFDDAARLLASVLASTQAYEAVSAKDGAEALELASQVRPDAAVLNIDMPEINGLEAAREMRNRFGDSVLLIALTARTELKEVLDSGLFQKVLRKPVNLNELFAALSKL